MRWTCCLLLATAALAHDDALVEAAKKLRARDFAGALADYDRAIEDHPDEAKAHAGRALALQALGRLDEALPSITKAIELEPGGAFYQQRAFLQLARGDEDAALADVTKGIEVDPGRGILYRVRADVLRQRYDYEGAVRDYSRACEIDPQDLTSIERRGQVKESLRDFEGAIEDFTRVADAAHRSPRPFYLRGSAKLMIGDWKGAVGDYDAALYNDDKDPYSYVGRARAKLALGEKEAADADAVQAAEMRPEANAFAERGRYWYDTGRTKEAAADLAKAVKMDPKQEYTRFFLFLARAKLGERAAAAAELKAYADGRGAKDDWYGKVAAFLTGGMEEEAFLVAAKAENPHLSREQECEASWYAAAVRLLDGDALGAKPLLGRCIATDVRNFIEYGSAQAALAAMK